ncbi:camp-binding domain-like protein [Rhizoclosmatium globosum]|uniref:Camp-binding domain-like protein n=1 Tax=Rhizoclosmatium globosum TaxID=329046 RepID=A0A1Y2CUT6_9FUNG|nr:camp-binding domain-like protein [Rhizoclosmatium globosum]|eukprot:ORY50801.1 camp-binding domain-like protein [Rhizoclosmatium globosum]
MTKSLSQSTEKPLIEATQATEQWAIDFSQAVEVTEEKRNSIGQRNSWNLGSGILETLSFGQLPKINPTIRRPSPARRTSNASQVAGFESSKLEVELSFPFISLPRSKNQTKKLSIRSDYSDAAGSRRKLNNEIAAVAVPEIKVVQSSAEIVPHDLSAGPEKPASYEKRDTVTTLTPKKSMGERPSKGAFKKIKHAATATVYTAKGSYASIQVDDNDVSNNDSSFWKYGINPMSFLYALSQVIFSVLHIIKLWIIPFGLAFCVHIPAEYSLFLTAVNLCDTSLEFCTLNQYFVSSQQGRILELKDWQRHYMTHGFILDFLTGLPLDLIPVEGSQYLWGIRLLRLYKLPGIFRTSPIYIQLLKKIQLVLGIGHSGSLIFPLAFLFCVFLHLQACILFLAGRLNGFSNVEIAHIEYKNVWQQYAWALLASVGNTFPLGYKPTEATEQWVVLIFSMIGALLYAVIVGAISSFAVGFDASGRLYKQKLDELREYMRWKDLAPTTRRKVLKYYDLKYRGKYFEEAALLNDMNDSLRMEIAAQNCRDLIAKVKFLRRNENDGRDELFVGKVAAEFIPCYYVTGDTIFTQGQAGTEMYFIVSGSIDVLAQGRHVATLNEGAFFGEVALIGNIPRTATVQAASSCLLYRLTRASFTSILEEFEDVKRTVDEIYRQRMAKVEEEEEARKISVAKSLASKVSFLNRHQNDGKDEEFLEKIGRALVPVFLVAGDCIFSTGDVAEEMYFIKSGTVDVRVKSNIVSTLRDGDFFGELALLTNLPRTATAHATSTSVLYKLTRDSLLKVLDDFQDMRELIERASQA